MRRLVRLFAVMAVVATLVAPGASASAGAPGSAVPTADASTPQAAARASAELAGVVPAVTTTAFKGSWSSYHTYAEMVADISAVASAHPDLVSLRSIGTSSRGRALWLAKVSENVTVDSGRPEVLFEGGTHGLEHMGVEMTIRLLHWLVDGYGTDAKVTSVVNTRTVWILFNLNPDGSEYDIANGVFHSWRKNRQPNATSTGTDLNRNWRYHWGCCGLVSANPASVYYRGSAPYSAPEVEALRAFVASRVVNGRQMIRTAIDFHESGRFVLWPYDYTTANVPVDMTAQDHSAIAALAARMAALNGYKAMQSSDMYVDSGSLSDWLYGTYRIFAYTVEMGVDVYRTNTVMLAETLRNRTASLALAAAAGCPYAVLGTAVATARCGAFDDDFEIARGWAVNPDGTDTAPASARWARGKPLATKVGTVTLQPGTVPSGRDALVTGITAGTSAGAADLDGTSTVRSVPIALPAGAGQRLAFRWLFAHAANSSADDHLRAIVEAQDGTQTVVWEKLGLAVVVGGTWGSVSVPLDAWAGQTIRIRFEAADGTADSTVEAGIDDVRVTRPA
jgi:carboxypeptidase T